MKRTLSLLLCALMLGSTMLAACSKGETAPETPTGEATAPVETEPEVTGRAAEKDNVPADFTLNGGTMAIFCYQTAEGANCYQSADELNGDLVQDATYEAARTVEGRLNVKFKMIISPSSWSDFGKEIETGVMAGTDEWNIIYTPSNASVQGGRDHLYLDVSNHKYIDIDQPWWWEATKTLSLDGKAVRYLIGDISNSHLSQSGAMFVNTKIFEDNFGDAAELYKKVIDRKWTLDELKTYAQAAYKDVNGNGQMDRDDILGVLSGNIEILRHVQFTTGVRSYTRSPEGYPVVDFDVDRAVRTVDAYNQLFYNTKGALYDGGTAYDSDKNKNDKNSFLACSVLFWYGRLGSYTNFRDMEDDYGIIPMPMLDLEQGEYTNAISNADIFTALPITCPNPDESGAVVEVLCAEAYRQILEPYYEKALKVKYSRDSYTGQCVDIIRDVTVKEFFNDYGSVTGNPFTITSNITKNANTVASDYASAKDSINAKITALVDKYKQLEADMK